MEEPGITLQPIPWEDYVVPKRTWESSGWAQIFDERTIQLHIEACIVNAQEAKERSDPQYQRPGNRVEQTEQRP